MSKVNKNATEHEFVTPDEEPAAKNNETKAEKFIRLGEYRIARRDSRRTSPLCADIQR